MLPLNLLLFAHAARGGPFPVVTSLLLLLLTELLKHNESIIHRLHFRVKPVLIFVVSSMWRCYVRVVYHLRVCLCLYKCHVYDLKIATSGAY